MVDIVIKSNLKSIKQCVSWIINLNEVTLDQIEVSKNMNCGNNHVKFNTFKDI